MLHRFYLSVVACMCVLPAGKAACLTWTQGDKTNRSKTTGVVFGRNLNSLRTAVKRHIESKMQESGHNADNTNPTLSNILEGHGSSYSSSQCLISVHCRTEGFRRSFLSTAIILCNTSTKGSGSWRGLFIYIYICIHIIITNAINWVFCTLLILRCWRLEFLSCDE